MAMRLSRACSRCFGRRCIFSREKEAVLESTAAQGRRGRRRGRREFEREGESADASPEALIAERDK